MSDETNLPETEPDAESEPRRAPPPAPGPIDEAKLLEVRKGLDALANRYRKSARWHLLWGMGGLVGGLALAVVLPALFILVDILVARIGDVYGPEPVQVDVADEQIVANQTERDNLVISRDGLAASARATRFGAMIFNATGSGPASLDDPRFAGGANCRVGGGGSYQGHSNGLPGSVFVPSSEGFGDLREGESTIYLDGPAGSECPAVTLDLSTTSVAKEGLAIRYPVVKPEYLLILGASAIPDGRSGRPVALACERTPAPGSRARCRELDFPAAVPGDWLDWSRQPAFDLGAGIVLDHRDGVFVLDSVLGPRGAEADLLDSVALRATVIDLPGGTPSSVLKSGNGVFLIQNWDSGGQPMVARVPPNLPGTSASYSADPKAVPVPEEFRRGVAVRDAVARSDGRILMLLGSDESPLLGLALSGAASAIALRSSGFEINQRDRTALAIETSADGTERIFIAHYFDAAGVGNQREIFVTEAAAALPLLDPAAFAAGGSAASEPDPSPPVFASVPPWGDRKALIPLRDAALYDSARRVSADLARSERSLKGLEDLRDSLTAAVTKQQEAETAVERQKLEVSVWITIAARLVVITLIFYFVSLQVHLYRYDSRHSAHYRSRVLAIDYLLATRAPLNDRGLETLYAAIAALDPRDISGKDAPGSPGDKLLDTLKEMFKARARSGG